MVMKIIEISIKKLMKFSMLIKVILKIKKIIMKFLTVLIVIVII
jgi:hypothetical protein